MQSLRAVLDKHAAAQQHLGERPVTGSTIGVIGGGDAAIDAARTALRIGAEEVSILYRRTRGEMPADSDEIDEAINEGIDIQFLVAPVEVLCDDFGVTGETIRRDLTELQRERLVRRVHGGAVPWRGTMLVPRLRVREGHMIEEKRRIARAALTEVPERGTLIIDSGSTALHLADMLQRDRDLVVVTNSIPMGEKAKASDTIRVLSVSKLLAEAIHRAHTGSSVSSLFV